MSEEKNLSHDRNTATTSPSVGAPSVGAPSVGAPATAVASTGVASAVAVPAQKPVPVEKPVAVADTQSHPAKATPAPTRPTQPDEMFRGDKTAALVMAARLAMRRGDRTGARNKLKEAFAIDPTDCGALEVLGDIFLEEAEQEKAIAVFERGQKYHPNHGAFEEKIALAHLDLAEMERDRIQRELLLTQGDTESWRDRKPARAFGLSLLLPGAGHYYAEENGRGAWFTGLWLLFFIAWYLPLNAGFGLLHAINEGGGAARITMSNALNQLHPFWLIWFYLFAFAFVLTYLAAAYDAWRIVEQANAARRKFLGL